MTVRQTSKRDLAAALQGRYLRAAKGEKGRLLDEFVAVTGYHRRYALTLLRHGRFPDPRLARVQGLPAAGATQRPRGRRGRPRAYSSIVIGALRTAAEAADWPCGKRLAPFLPALVPALEREGALTLTAADRVLLSGMSAAPVDRRLRPFRLARGGRGWGTTKPGTLLKQQIPIQTYTPWEDQRPGFVEIDLVAHCGTSTAGQYLNTLTVTDVATAWTECVGVLGKSQRFVLAALQAARARFPFPWLGIDSDNGSEFLNEHLVRYCREEELTFTRSRPYWKNDQAHVEQKNWSVVRRLVGYGRYETPEALAQLNRVYDELRLWTNFWQPTLKLIAKTRDGTTGKARKTYDAAQTPYQRVRAADSAPGRATALLPDADRAALAETFAGVGPRERKRRLAAALEQFYRLQERSQPLAAAS